MNIDLCDQLPILANIQCSDISIGPYELTFNFPYPSMMPDIPVTEIEMVVTNTPQRSGIADEFTCLKADIGIIGGNLDVVGAGGMSVSDTGSATGFYQTASETIMSETRTDRATETAGIGCGDGIVGNGLCESGEKKLKLLFLI